MKNKGFILFSVTVLLVGLLWSLVNLNSTTKITGMTVADIQEVIQDSDDSLSNYFEKQLPSGLIIYNRSLMDNQPLFILSKGEFQIVDREMNVLHSWSNPQTKIGGVLLDSGDIVAVSDNLTYRMNWNSTILWNRTITKKTHHDMDYFQDTIYILTSVDEVVPDISTELITNDYIILLTPEKIIKEISLANVVKNSELNITDLGKDLFHTNTIKVLRKSIPGVGRKGDILVAIRNQNLVAILDPDTEKIIWSWGSNDLERPHSPRITEEGTILIFDNGVRRKYSRVIELKPLTKEFVWQFTKEDRTMFTSVKGAAIKMQNNVLIQSYLDRRVLEVTPTGEIIWEYFGNIQPLSIIPKKLTSKFKKEAFVNN